MIQYHQMFMSSHFHTAFEFASYFMLILQDIVELITFSDTKVCLNYEVDFCEYFIESKS